jgi:hypothetical protein
MKRFRDFTEQETSKTDSRSRIVMYDDYEKSQSLLVTRDKFVELNRQEERSTKAPPIKGYGGNYIDNYASSLTASHSNIIALDDFLNRKNIKESKNSYNILKKMPVEDLPKTEYLDLRSHVGEFISDADLDKVYEDDFSDCLHKMNDTSILCFTCVDGAQTWWAPKMNDGKVIGLVRTK